LELHYTYDAAGNVVTDNMNQYLYGGVPVDGSSSTGLDAEGRLCAVSGPSGSYGYLYDAEGNRVGKGTISSLSCNTASNGFTLTASYILGPGGQQLTELDWAGATVSNWHTNVWAGGQLVGTYSPNLDPETSARTPPRSTTTSPTGWARAGS
jgi:YD repeat-containing protein